jgi:hypothetical protein
LGSTGAAPQFVDQPPAADQPAIVVGDCEESRRAGIDAAKIPIEGFIVSSGDSSPFEGVVTADTIINDIKTAPA